MYSYPAKRMLNQQAENLGSGQKQEYRVLVRQETVYNNLHAAEM